MTGVGRGATVAAARAINASARPCAGGRKEQSDLWHDTERLDEGCRGTCGATHSSITHINRASLLLL